jgi:hypothetical protein
MTHRGNIHSLKLCSSTERRAAGGTGAGLAQRALDGLVDLSKKVNKFDLRHVQILDLDV